MRKCPYCAEEIQAEAIKCKHCGSMLDDAAGWTGQQPRSAATTMQTGPAAALTVTDLSAGNASVRKGVTQAKFNEESSGLITLEIVGLAVAGGLAMSSWIVGGIIFFGLMILFWAAPKVFELLTVLMSLGWGYAGWLVGSRLFGGTGAGVVIALVAFAVTMGMHLAGIQHLKDIAPDSDNSTAVK